MGFRPFVYRLAHEEGLGGWVLNNAEGVVLEVQGKKSALDRFQSRLRDELPSVARIVSLRTQDVPVIGEEPAFVIRASDEMKEEGAATATVLADLAPCPDCLSEINDTSARRYRYPFTTCTNCGPRYTIMTGLPYDRQKTTLAEFPLCDDCARDYGDPLDRRFHAQPLACPACGPHLSLCDATGREIVQRDDALYGAVAALREGKVVAAKGVGGFHLLCDAANAAVLATLRGRKHRPTKPFALMAPDIASVRVICRTTEKEEALLMSPAAPIVLLESRRVLPPALAPSNPTLGVMLPPSPLHHLLMQAFGGVLVATSGNRASEPVCIDNEEALEKLAGLADLFLLHNRPIAHRADDSIVRVMDGHPIVLRRARGYAPLPIASPVHAQSPVLAMGAHMKNTVTLALGGQLIASPHVGDLDTREARTAHKDAQETLCALYRLKQEDVLVAHDLHPDYASSHYHGGVSVQHHYAHALACRTDNGLDGSALAIVWDGTGYGDDGTIWGGEFLHITEEGYTRFAHLLPFPLIGGDAAAKDPKRVAVALLEELGEDFASFPIPDLDDETRRLYRQMRMRGVNCLTCSSMGRLFDGVSALLGLCSLNSFEGEAAMQVEFKSLQVEFKSLSREAGEGFREGAGGKSCKEPQPAHSLRSSPLLSPSVTSFPAKAGEGLLDWKPIVRHLLSLQDEGEAARYFHEALIDAALTIVVERAKKTGESRVLLTGGCFQNKALSEGLCVALRAAGLEPYLHRMIPPNDGGVSVGQALAALLKEKGKMSCV